MTQELAIRPMTRWDIPFGMMLKDCAGWNQLQLDWERFLEFEPEGCLVAEVGGVPAGTATAIAYGRAFGWVGMVLVHPEMRRQGVGRTLLMAGIEYLEGSGVRAVKLDATPMGKRLYDTLGFVDEYRMERWMGRGSTTRVRAPGLRELTLRDLERLVAFDTPIFGANRERVLRRMLAETTVRTAAATDGRGHIVGFAAVRPGQNAAYIGPCAALTPEVGKEMWAWALGMAGPRPVYVDLLMPNASAVELARRDGFEKQRDLIRMYRGENVSPGRPDLQYAIFGPETG